MHANRLHLQLSLLAFVGWLSEGGGGLRAQTLCRALLLPLTTNGARQEASHSHDALQNITAPTFSGTLVIIWHA